MIFFGHPKTEVLSRSLDDMLGPMAQAKLDQHLENCADCQASFKGMAQIRRDLRTLPPVADPIELPPQFIPVVKPVFSPWAVGVGLVLGGLLVGTVALRPITAPMKVISSNPPGLGAEGLVEKELSPGASMRTLEPGPVDLEIKNQILLRLKPGTTITWQQINRPFPFFGRPQIVVNLMRGQMLARTKEGFWGSEFEIRTPTANATVKGTAFSMGVEPKADATTLKVLAGQVFFSSYLGQVGVSVEAGQSSRILGDMLPPKIETLTSQERQALLETYQIGEDPLVALVIGAGPERVNEFLKPALLYLSERSHPQLHGFIRKSVKILNERLLESELGNTKWDLNVQAKQLKVLERALEDIDDPALTVPLRLYVAAYEIHLGYPRRARLHLRWVANKSPNHPLAPLALAALGTIAQKQLINPVFARKAFEELLSQYPQSAEADLAREFLKK